VPIPGTKRLRYLEDNMGTVRVELSAADLKDIREHVAKIPVAGERYTPEMMALVNR